MAGKTRPRLQQVRCLIRATLCLQGGALVLHPLSWARKEQCVLAEMEVKGQGSQMLWGASYHHCEGTAFMAWSPPRNPISCHQPIGITNFGRGHIHVITDAQKSGPPWLSQHPQMHVVPQSDSSRVRLALTSFVWDSCPLTILWTRKMLRWNWAPPKICWQQMIR